MMKHHSKLVAGLATLAVVPALALPQEEIKALENALAGTVHALEVLAGIEKELESDPENGTQLILSATEAPQMEGEVQDDRLSSLRRQVSLLRMELDAIESPMAGDPATGPDGTLRDANDPSDNRQRPAPIVSTGLPESMRSMMRRSMNPEKEAAKTQAIGKVASTRSKPGVEPGAYTADSLGQAKASYHAGRFEDGLVLLEGSTDTQALYWKARCLTRLERYDEAIDLLTSIVAAGGETYEARRAKTDLEFAQWKRGFNEKLPADLKKGGKQ